MPEDESSKTKAILSQVSGAVRIAKEAQLKSDPESAFAAVADVIEPIAEPSREQRKSRSKHRVRPEVPQDDDKEENTSPLTHMFVRFSPLIFFASSALLLFVSIYSYTQMERRISALYEPMQNHLVSAAQSLKLIVTAEELERYKTLDDANTSEYEELKDRLREFTQDHNVLYAYFWRYYGEVDGEEKGQFIIDGDDNPETMVGLYSFFPIDEVVKRSMRNAELNKTSVTDFGEYTPNWEGIVTGDAGVRNEDDKVVAYAGVDISDQPILEARSDAAFALTMEIIALILSLICGLVSMILYRKRVRAWVEVNEKLQYFNNNLRRAFSTYLSEDVVEEIVSDPTRLQLGGVRRYMTAMFTDVQNFTHIAEYLSPENLIELLNNYLSTMSDVILAYRGTIDKYEGDAIVAFFGAPIEMEDHALRACLSAIMMKRLETELNEQVLQNGESPKALLTRIGINSGDMIVGNIGTERKMNYTIMSNAANLASRIEGVNKFYGTWILASEDTVKAVSDKIFTRKIDTIRVVGIKEKVTIYEIIETQDAVTPETREWVEVWNQAMTGYEDRDWAKAKESFEEVLTLNPYDSPSRIYIKRLTRFIAEPPANDWDGVIEMEYK
ncbi:MAG: adenylate/guanylate cyclase domain-containing protein [Helicobacteraceae bacterium]|jgi:class 3 adenylate cyclase|nr:adenylate/guanylate cyclase domain-containing protein [Helicobacteraceae bacterium]